MSRIIKPDASFTPRELFARMQGAWFEPRQGSMWQENTGVTPTTSGGQTVGLLLDQSQQAQLGPELVTNGDFSNGTTGWADGPYGITKTVEAGELKLVCTSIANAYVGQVVPTEVGKTYTISFSARPTIGDYKVYLYRADGTTFLASITNGYKYTAQYTSVYVALVTFGAAIGNTTYFDNISVREVLGNHAYQATAANRPTLQFNGPLPLIRYADATDVLTASLPDRGGGVFSSAGSVYFATPQGMSCLHNQSIGISYNLPALQTDIYGTVITPARLAPPLEKRLELYMHRLAGLADADFFWQEQATDGMEGQLLADDGTILLRG